MLSPSGRMRIGLAAAAEYMVTAAARIFSICYCAYLLVVGHNKAAALPTKQAKAERKKAAGRTLWGVVFFTRGGGDTRVTRDTRDTLDTGVTGDTVGGAR